MTKGAGRDKDYDAKAQCKANAPIGHKTMPCKSQCECDGYSSNCLKRTKKQYRAIGRPDTI